jgi:hypothetical protein
MKPILAALLLATALLSACDRTVPPPTAEEQQAILEDAPEIFATRGDNATLKGIETIYLGQPKDDALEALADFCPKTMEYRGGRLSDDAWFRGCVLREPKGPIVSIRVGFWPRLGDQVSTLEVKRNDIGIDAARERFRQFADEVIFDIPHPGMVEMRAPKYQMIADIDEGADGPTHITFGYSRKWAKQLEEKPADDES